MLQSAHEGKNRGQESQALDWVGSGQAGLHVDATEGVQDGVGCHSCDIQQWCQQCNIECLEAFNLSLAWATKSLLWNGRTLLLVFKSLVQKSQRNWQLDWTAINLNQTAVAVQALWWVVQLLVYFGTNMLPPIFAQKKRLFLCIFCI